MNVTLSPILIYTRSFFFPVRDVRYSQALTEHSALGNKYDGHCFDFLNIFSAKHSTGIFHRLKIKYRVG